jgi:flagellar biosynthesis protein FlhF
MHVRKYEADSMDEVLKAIKHELGPDAIILKSEEFKGIKGAFKGRKFEVTAAISEDDYAKKKKLDSLLNSDEKSKLYQTSSKNIESSLDKVAKHTKAPASYGNLALNRSAKQMQSISDEARMPSKSASLHESEDLSHELDNFLRQSDSTSAPAGLANNPNRDYSRVQSSQVELTSQAEDFERGPNSWTGVNTMSSPELQNLQRKFTGQQMEIEELRNKLAEIGQSMNREGNQYSHHSNREDEYSPQDEKLKSLQHNLKVFDFSFPIIQEICKKIQGEFENLNMVDDDQIYDFVMKELERKIHCQTLTFLNKRSNDLSTSNQANTSSGANLMIFISEYSSGQSSLIYKLASSANRPTILRLEQEESFDSHDALASKILRADIKSYKKTTELITALRDLTKSDASGDIFIDLKVPSDRPEEVINLIQSLRRSYQKIEVILVLSSLHQELITKKMLSRYRSWVDGVAITHADSALGMGGLYSAIVQYDRPIYVLSNGRRIPKDWKQAESGYIVKKIFGVAEENGH